MWTQVGQFKKSECLYPCFKVFEICFNVLVRLSRKLLFSIMYKKNKIKEELKVLAVLPLKNIVGRKFLFVLYTID